METRSIVRRPRLPVWRARAMDWWRWWLVCHAGSPNDMTSRVEAFAKTLGRRTSLPIVLQDERLTSFEAESRLAIREKDWRVRKQRLDAAAAAIILQDYLDSRS
jgi:putative transcription antitermination factor YqgF